MLVLDSHVHCGITLPYERIQTLWEESDIDGGVLFPPVEEIYDRTDPDFVDSTEYRESREKAHSYLESLVSEWIFIYWFVWNDFKYPRDFFSGIKWHRHSHEPRYLYNSEDCEKFLEEICRREMPVIIEDELENTIELCGRIKGRTPVIIPHLGMLNGGYRSLKKAGLFENPAIYVDTALAGPEEIGDFAADYGVDRILFGSDFPFGNPGSERFKVEHIFTGTQLEKVFSGNLLSLLGKA